MKRSSDRFYFSRRQFVLSAAATTAATSLPLILPARVFGADAPSKRVRVGQIGCGRIAQGHDMPGVLNSGLADIVAVCDLDSKRAADAKKLIETFHREKGTPAPDVRVFSHYEELLQMPDLDAVVISTPDHWHAEPALAAV
ncbi:MAG: Gfo/Idh/MocA family protein, partial [Povalibacter sp.]